MMALPSRIHRPSLGRSAADKGADRKAPDHLRLIRLLPCVVCGAWPVEAHHLLHADDGKGMGRKAADKWALPLCPEHHHQGAHKHGDDEAWLAGRGLDGRAICDALWRNRGDQDGMRRAVDRARQDAALKVRP